jgi:type VI secretion system protein ImpM
MPALTAWIFGKLPTHGDFVFRGLPLKERTLLDDWLSQEMQSAHAKLGDEFYSFYDSAPPWCFAVDKDDGAWEGGAICPSMDSAGRRFPLLVARAGLAPKQAGGAAHQCVDAIYRAFEESMTADALWNSLTLLSLEASNEDAECGWWVEGENNKPLIKLDGQLPVGLIVTMLEGGAQ